MPKTENPESFETKLAAVHERLDLAEKEMHRARMGFRTLLLLVYDTTEAFSVLAEGIRVIAAGLDLGFDEDLDEDGEGEPTECEEIIRLGGVEMTITPDGEVSIERPPRSPSAGSGL